MESIADFDVHDRLHEIVCPTLVLVGGRDSITPPSAGAAIAKEVPGAKSVILPDFSHMLNIEAPLAVNAEIRQFLSRTLIPIATEPESVRGRKRSPCLGSKARQGTGRPARPQTGWC